MILIISLCKEKLHYHEFIRPIEAIVSSAGHKHTTVGYTDLQPKNISDASAVIICGTSLSDFAYQDFDLSILMGIRVPLFAVCAGMQMVCKAFGCKLIKGEELGLQEVNFEEFLGARGRQQVYCLHKMAVKDDRTLQEKFRVYAKSKCIQAIKHRELPIYCTLFHPEVRHEGMIRKFLAGCR